MLNAFGFAFVMRTFVATKTVSLITKTVNVINQVMVDAE